MRAAAPTTWVALFGTSADPPTEGHKAILAWLSDRFDCVAVWASDNPFKSHQTALAHRMEMLRLTIADLNCPAANMRLCKELSSSRSWVTVCAARKIWGAGAHLTFVVGSDLVPQMPRWYAARDLLQAVELAIVPRPGYPLQVEDLKRLSQLGAVWDIADLTAPAVSSTAYREQRAADAIPLPVQKYIDRYQLYA
ncbi:nicotinic acid mononucleotide adenylyltransferase [Rubidibacter lacunae KORDI 51-2]|uniref:nicotinate-nucleotide adenylyltransferase n=1 Tax=Rubidibacter lacunae KORDI 51-2 TaxID=582515 RepID=U5DT01_9CHRO|nr:nicotinate-nucleotide adenylyltransferase [Rubidibacter lacunae]ERN42815.1 nicotinic acid mononucleotide adenylyltransferase [Rubidibacter lacunae KORDI 51-2]